MPVRGQLAETTGHDHIKLIQTTLEILLFSPCRSKHKLSTPDLLEGGHRKVNWEVGPLTGRPLFSSAEYMLNVCAVMPILVQQHLSCLITLSAQTKHNCDTGNDFA